jgi:hypothetical protein
MNSLAAVARKPSRAGTRHLPPSYEPLFAGTPCDVRRSVPPASRQLATARANANEYFCGSLPGLEE